MPRVKLTYFDFGVRADAVRIALHMAGVEFEDKRIDFKEFAELREAGELPLDQIPVVEVDGVKYTQYNAQARWAATLAGIYPEDALDRLKAEEFVEITSEILYKLPMAKEDEERKRVREEYQATQLAKWFTFMDKRIAEHGGEWATGNDFSIADLSIMVTIDFIKSGFIDHLNTKYHEDYSNINNLYNKIKQHEPVAKFYASDK